MTKTENILWLVFGAGVFLGILIGIVWARIAYGLGPW